MQKFWSANRRWLNWALLFLIAAVLAVGLSHGIARSPSYSDVTSSPSPGSSPAPSGTSSRERALASSEDSAATVAVQTRHDRPLAHYATVSRSDGSFRQMFVTEDAIATIQPGEPLPDGTLIVMETWYSPENLGTVFIKQKQDGEWQYGSFSPDRPDYQMGFSGSCHTCHAPFPDVDFTLTKPLLEAALQTQKIQTAYCDRPGRSPCHPDAYIPEQVN